MKQQSFEDALKFGEEGEHEIARYLIEHGVTLLTLYQFDKQHSPYLINSESKIIAPDLFCYGKDAFFAEVKTKRRWISYKGVRETGIDSRAFESYKQVQEETGKKVLLFFNHKVQEPLGFFFVPLLNYTRFWDGMNCKTGSLTP